MNMWGSGLKSCDVGDPHHGKTSETHRQSVVISLRRSTVIVKNPFLVSLNRPLVSIL